MPGVMIKFELVELEPKNTSNQMRTATLTFGLLVCFFSAMTSCKTQQEKDGVFSSLDAALNDPASVKKLVLAEHYDSLPASIANLVNLEELDMRTTGVRILPAEIGRLGKLRILTIEGGNLKTLPDEICQLGALEEVHLHANLIDRLPGCFFQMKNLRYIDLSGNHLSNINMNMTRMEKLEELKLEHNEIDSLSATTQFPSGLKVLDLRNNRIRSVPSDLSAFSRIKEIKLQGCHLDDSEIKRMQEALPSVNIDGD